MFLHKNRMVCMFWVLLAIIFISSAHANPKSKSSVLLEAAQAIGALGDAISSITDGVKKLVVTSTKGVDYVLAEKTRSDLKDLGAKSMQFTITNNMFFINSIEEYLFRRTPDTWKEVKISLTSVLTDGEELLSEWKEQRSDFVLEEAYEKLYSSLHSRLSIVKKINHLGPPETEEELEALKKVKVEYESLIIQFREAVKELNLYIKNKNA